MEEVGALTTRMERLEDLTLAPMRGTGRHFYIWVGFLLAVIALGAVAYSFQAREGLFATGMRDRIMWGLYVALFVVFIGASMAGTFVSAILRLSNAEWRGPIVRGAEIMTVAALITAALFIMFDMGRPDRAHHILLYGRWESPLVWDVYGLSTYLAGSMIYLYLAMIPDLALARDRIGDVIAPPLRFMFRIFAVGWTGEPGQVRHLTAALVVMTIIMIPVAVMMHTVTSWIFGMTLREPWNNPMFGIFFVGGAIYSGVGLIAILMSIMRKAYHL